jgi:hypothetical protein
MGAQPEPWCQNVFILYYTPLKNMKNKHCFINFFPLILRSKESLFGRIIDSLSLVRFFYFLPVTLVLSSNLKKNEKRGKLDSL